MQVRWLVADIERCIFVLYCFGWAVLRRSFKPEQSPNKFVRCQVAPSAFSGVLAVKVSTSRYALDVLVSRDSLLRAAVRVDPVCATPRASTCNNRRATIK